MMSTKSVLIEARNLIADIEHWTQGEFAIENTGLPCDPTSPMACAWCADGAIRKITNSPIHRPAHLVEMVAATRALKEAAADLFKETGYLFSHVTINDGEAGIPDDTLADPVVIAHANILKVFDAAIARAS